MFIENPAGSFVKHIYDEKRLVPVGQQNIRVPYPFTYGFLPGVPAPDGDCLDCFLLDTLEVASGDLFEVEVVGVLEQIEESGDGLCVQDHNLLARRVAATADPSESELGILIEFIGSVFGDAGPRMHVGPAHGVDRAEELLAMYQDSGGR